MLNAFNNRLTVAARGVRKINEQTIQEGRALVITDDAPYSWSDIPNGSLKVDTETGIIYVKLRGESDWVPSNIRTDIPRDSDGNVIYGVNGTETGHTLLIAKDSKIVHSRKGTPPVSPRIIKSPRLIKTFTFEIRMTTFLI